MVKNKKGGSGHKRMARKNVTGGDGGYNNKLRKPVEDGEILARVIQINGGKFAFIMCSDGVTRNLVIRGQFSRRKRGNRIEAGTLVMAGLRDWEVTNGKKKEKADLLEVYSAGEAAQLQRDGELSSFLLDETKTEDDNKQETFIFDKSASANDFSGQSESFDKPANQVLSQNNIAKQNTKITDEKEIFMQDVDWDDI